MSVLSVLDGSPLGFTLALGLMCALLGASAWLATAPDRHAPNAEAVSACGLVALGLAALVGAPIAVLLAILVLWAVALTGYEAGWLGWRCLRHAAPHPR